jgi:hypothetical protein
MSGVADNNVFASVSGPGSTTLGAVWGASDLVGDGRVAVLMDVNWAEPWEQDGTTAPQIAQNLAYFLSGLSAPPTPLKQVARPIAGAPRSARSATPSSSGARSGS